MKKNILNIIAVSALLVGFSGSFAAQNQSPIITISSPSNESIFSAPATITITANASTLMAISLEYNSSSALLKLPKTLQPLMYLSGIMLVLVLIH